jgi:tRNA uridine 5-carboxymethylaminomethyl modification enzyme
MAALNAARARAKSLTVTPNKAEKFGLALNRDGQRRSAFELLAYPEVGWSEVRSIWPELSDIESGIAVHLEIDAKYEVYLKRQVADIDSFRRDESLALGEIDYASVPGLSNEARARLETARPRTVGQAGRLDGVTPAALGILISFLRREARRKSLIGFSAASA